MVAEDRASEKVKVSISPFGVPSSFGLIYHFMALFDTISSYLDEDAPELAVAPTHEPAWKCS
jgi:hypothetical protein